MTEPGEVGMSAASAANLMDYTVQNSQGEGLGEIEDLLIDVNTEEIRYAVLSFGGFLEIGEKLFAIPVSAFTVDTENNVVLFDVDQETLENAPGFDLNNWPDTANPEWDVPYRDFWKDRSVIQTAPGETTDDTATDDAVAEGDAATDDTVAQGDTTADNAVAEDDDTVVQGDTPADDTVAEGGVTTDDIVAQGDTTTDQSDMLEVGTVRASEMLGYNIETSAGDDVGEIEDLVVDLHSGRVLYAVLSFGGFADIGENFYAIPLRVLNFNNEAQAFVLDVDETMLQNAPSFSMDAWPDNINPNLGMAIK